MTKEQSMPTTLVKLSQIRLNSANPRRINKEKFESLLLSVLVLPRMLELRPIVVDNTMTALGGNMRFRALTAVSDMTLDEIQNLLSRSSDFQRKTQAEQDSLLEYWEKWKDNPTAYIIKATELSDEEKRQFIIKDNLGYGDWDTDMLANEWDVDELKEWGLDLLWDKTETDEETGEENSEGGEGENSHLSLNDKFVVPPFSILDTRRGYWQERKKQWREFIGDLGETREDKQIQSLEMKYKDLYQKSKNKRKELGVSFREYVEKYTSKEELEREQAKNVATGVSIFDPVLSELVCRWFAPFKGAKIFDCFSGDTQKGLVFAQCGYEFTGIELREEQVEVNNRIISGRNLPVKYICDDGQNVSKYFEPESQDLFFSCPPYFDLEVYSDLPNDASNQGTYEEFIEILRNAFTSAMRCLKQDSFAVVCVGDVRDKKTGSYYDFVGDVKRIFREAGLLLYNDIILVEIGATAAIRADRYMETRKVVKMHQNVLVFYKGNPKNIKKKFPKIEFTDDDSEFFKRESLSENNSETI